MQIKSFLQLRTWQEGHALALEIYKTTKEFPSDERYGLTSQLRRAAVSVPSNIAEGMGRATSKDRIRFFVQARSSIQEILSQLYLARDLIYLTNEDFERLINRYNGLSAGIATHIDHLN